MFLSVLTLTCLGKALGGSGRNLDERGSPITVAFERHRGPSPTVAVCRLDVRVDLGAFRGVVSSGWECCCGGQER